MRFVVFVALLMLAGCATRPDDAYSYKGVYVAGGASIADDGSFASAASVWKADDLALAKEAAIVRLTLAASGAGYTHAMVTSEKSGPFIGYQYRLAGKLFKPGSAPETAWPMAEIEAAIAEIGANVETATAKPLQSKAAPVKLLKKPVIEELPKTDEEPLVIEAPDFITAVPLKRPVG